MIRCDETTVGYDLAEARGGKSEVTFPDRVCQQRVTFSLPNRLVSSITKFVASLPKSSAMAG